MTQHNVTGFDHVKFFFPYAPKSTQTIASSNSLNDCIKRQQTLIEKTFHSVMHLLKPNGVFVVNGYIKREAYYTPNIDHAELIIRPFDGDGCLKSMVMPIADIIVINHLNRQMQTRHVHMYINNDL